MNGVAPRHSVRLPQHREATSDSGRDLVVRARGGRAPYGCRDYLTRCGYPRACAAPWVAPCTTTIRGLSSEVLLEPSEDPITRRSCVNLDSIESVSIAVLVERLGRLSDERMHEVCAALAVTVDCQG